MASAQLFKTQVELKLRFRLSPSKRDEFVQKNENVETNQFFSSLREFVKLGKLLNI